jgi:hypothetical protein
VLAPGTSTEFLKTSGNGWFRVAGDSSRPEATVRTQVHVVWSVMCRWAIGRLKASRTDAIRRLPPVAKRLHNGRRGLGATDLSECCQPIAKKVLHLLPQEMSAGSAVE